jgi:hypothetical protein
MHQASQFILSRVDPPPGKAGTTDLAIPPGQVCLSPAAWGPATLGTGPDAGQVPAIVFEALLGGHSSLLLALFPHGGWRGVRINGHQALPASLLHANDLIRFAWGTTIRVALQFRHHFSTPGPAHLGRPCLFCRSELTAQTTILVCPSCGAGLHMEGPEIPAEKRLECALLLSACPRCSLPLPRRISEGHAHAS